MDQPRSRRTPLLPLLLIGALLWAVTAAGVVSTNALGFGDRIGHLADRVRLALDPPPDRAILPIVEVTPEPRGGDDGPRQGNIGGPGEEEPERTPRPRRKPVDVKLRANPGRTFVSQQTNDWCAPAGVQIVLAMHGRMDNSADSQRKLANQIGKWEAWKDSHNGGWGPSAIAQALADHGVKGYEIRSYGSRRLALRDSAIALSKTRAPVILIAWRGAHTWVMSGFRATADPTIFRNAKITGTYIFDPWYPRVSTIWGPSDGPGVFQDQAEMARNFLRWDRPEGAYQERDGKFLAVVPTIPLEEQRRGS